MALFTIVATGLVVGVIEATRPIGAISVSIIPCSPVSMIGSRSSGPGRPGDEEVLAKLVLHPPQAGLLVGHLASWSACQHRPRIEATTVAPGADLERPRRRPGPRPRRLDLGTIALRSADTDGRRGLGVAPEP